MSVDKVCRRENFDFNIHDGWFSNSASCDSKELFVIYLYFSEYSVNTSI